MRISKRAIAVAARLALLTGICAAELSAAQTPPRPRLPIFFDPDTHPPKPDLEKVRSIRFLTTDDFPPFHFTLADGTPGGFDIDLVRAICADLKIACTIQSRQFDTLIPQLKAGKDDALIAAIANTPDSRKDLDFSAPYYATPARFATLAASPLDQISPLTLAGHTIGVEAGTAHEAYLRTFFPTAEIKSFPSQTALRAAVWAGKIEAMFGDGISLALWLNGTDAASCCVFRGGPYTESRYFGNGVSIAVAKDNNALRLVLDYELTKLSADGTYADLYLKYFPIGFY